jgi:maleate isomerase
MSCGFGTRARIGHLYPSGGLCDYEIQLMAPDGVQFLTSRLPFRHSSPADDASLLNDLEAPASLVADARVDLIALNCTAAGVLAGATQINRRIEAATGIRAVTTIEAVLAALHAVGAKRVALLTPYLPEVVAAETGFLARQGIDVVAEHAESRATPFEQAMIFPTRWLELAGRMRGAPADALLISCAGIQLATQLEAIEKLLGRPEVTSNQACCGTVCASLASRSGAQATAHCWLAISAARRTVSRW